MPPKRPTVRRPRAAADRPDDDRHLCPFAAGDRVVERVTRFTGTVTFVTSAGGVLVSWDWWAPGKTQPYCAGLLRKLEPADIIIDAETFEREYLGRFNTGGEPSTTTNNHKGML